MNRKGFKQMWVLPFLGLIWLYQTGVSPFLPSSCIYHPSCSTYAKQALSKHGLFKGLFLTLRRLLRCQPFCQGGMDPVPDHFSFFKS